MKKIYLLLTSAFLLFSIISQAQIKKGATFLGGDISGTTQTTKNNGTELGTLKGLTFSPVFGKAIKENLILGGDLQLSFQKERSSFNKYKNRLYGAGIFLRKYKQLGNSDFSLFLQGRLGADYVNQEFESSPFNVEESKTFTLGVKMYPGISYAISKRLQLETGFNNLISIGYYDRKLFRNQPLNYNERTKGFSINSSLNNLSSLYVGFRLLLNK